VETGGKERRPVEFAAIRLPINDAMVTLPSPRVWLGAMIPELIVPTLTVLPLVAVIDVIVILVQCLHYWITDSQLSLLSCTRRWLLNRPYCYGGSKRSSADCPADTFVGN
jgi:hypothetical protein